MKGVGLWYALLNPLVPTQKTGVYGMKGVGLWYERCKYDKKKYPFMLEYKQKSQGDNPNAII